MYLFCSGFAAFLGTQVCGFRRPREVPALLPKPARPAPLLFPSPARARFFSVLPARHCGQRRLEPARWHLSRPSVSELSAHSVSGGHKVSFFHL